jgi:hypothetical protein
LELGWICCAVSVVGGEDDTTAATLLPGSDEQGGGDLRSLHFLGEGVDDIGQLTVLQSTNSLVSFRKLILSQRYRKQKCYFKTIYHAKEPSIISKKQK